VGQIKLLIVDDHPLFRQGLVDVLETDPLMAVVGQAADGAVALAVARDLRPDVILMDINLPNANGLDLTATIIGEMPQTKVVMLTGYDELGQVHQALVAGAVAFCTKDVPPERLLSVIHSVSAGDYYVNGQTMTADQAAQWLTEREEGLAVVQTMDHTIWARLSPREMEILELVAQGSSNKEIAFLLNISQQTVKNHMTAILRKLQVEDRTQAAVTAIRNGWVRLTPQTK
jgi:DNA-binding NarL/FixJ family response regulator